MLVGLLCARDVRHVPGRLGADDARAGRDHPRLALGRARAAQRLRLRRGDASRRRPACGLRCSCSPSTARSAGTRSTPRRRSGALVAVAALIGFGAKAGVMPLHVWLPRAHPTRARARLGADERRDDQGRAVRPDARARSTGSTGRRCGSAWRWSCWAPCRRWAASCYALFQHELKRLLALSLDRERRHHPARARRRAGAARAGRARLGGRSRSPRRCCTRSTTPSSRRCCSSAPARSSAPSTGSSSIAWADCCAACPGPAARS